MNFPFARSIVVVRARTHIKESGQTRGDTRYYISSLEPQERSPKQWHHLIRRHWAGVEIRNHWKRDSIWGEDRSRTRNSTALANLALLRNALLALLPEHFPDTPLPVIHEHLQAHSSRCLHIVRS